MKRFDFPLERVRRWRLEQQNVEELKLQQLRAELGGLTAVRREMQQHLCEWLAAGGAGPRLLAGCDAPPAEEVRAGRLLEELDRTSREQRERMPRLTRLRESLRDSGRLRVPEVLRRSR